MHRRPITIDDLYTIKLVADANIAPDASRVAYVVTTVDRESNGYRSNIWCVPLTGDREPYRLTTGCRKDTSPRWSPDGTMLAFLSDRAGKNQVYVLPADGGEAWQVTDVPNGASDFSWSADSRSLVFVSKVDLPEEDKPASDVRVIRDLIYKLDGEGFLDGKHRHVFIVAAESGEPRQLTNGDWDCTQPALSPDGRQLAFVSNRRPDRRDNTFADVWVQMLATGATRRVTPEDGQYGTPVWTADGRSLVYTGHPVVAPYGPTTLDDLYLHDLETDEPRSLLGALDREPGNSIIADMRYGMPAQGPVVSADGSRVLTLISDRGSVAISAASTAAAPATVVSGARDIQSFTVATDGTVAFVASDMQLPPEVYVVRGDGVEERITRTNDEFLSGIELGAVEEVTFESDPGVEVHGWLLRPSGFNSSAKYPAIVEIHGGPHGMYGTGFFHELHVLAARGYVVLYTNPRGSTGYGQDFVAGSLNDWGGADYRDVMAGVPFLESLPYIDGARLGVTGGSYGGYMTNWIIGQTDRFKAAVTQRSTSNRISSYGTSDLNVTYNDWEFQGTPYDNPEFYRERSPLTYVKNVTTPLLILHSENDLRCPITQGEELFVALRKCGKEVEFVRFPDESHNLSRTGKPAHRIERLERICGWFDRYM